MSEPRDLFAWGASRAARGLPRDHTARWLAFVARRPDVAARVLAWCQAKRDEGERRISMARCWEALRGTVGAGERLDNSWRAPAAHWVMARDPSLTGLIPVKGTR